MLYLELKMDISTDTIRWGPFCSSQTFINR